MTSDELEVISSEEAAAAADQRPNTNAKDSEESRLNQQWQIRIDLPTPPNSELLLVRNDGPTAVDGDAPAEQDQPLGLVIFCSPQELVKDLKNLVTEMEGYWLGAFSFVRVLADASTQEEGDDGKYTKLPIDDWIDVQTVFAGSTYEDSTVPKVLKVVDIPFDDTEMKLHIQRAHEVLCNSYPAFRARHIYRAPAYDPNGIALDSGLTLYTSIRDSVDSKNSKSNGKQKENSATSETEEHAFTNWTTGNPEEPYKSFVDRRTQLDSRPAPVPCVKQFSISPWSPPPQSFRMRGHLMYVTVTTLEGEYLHIVGTTRGLYIDRSDSSHFDTTPRKNGAEKFHQSVFGLLADQSPKFLHAMKQLTVAQVAVHPDLFATAAIQNCTPPGPWLARPPAPTADPFRSQVAFLSTGCTDPEFLPTARDWNDEFTMVRELPKSTIGERLLRERLLSKLQHDMSAAAVRTVVGIVHGDILPANPTDPPNLHTVVHQNLLFVPAVDSLDSYGHLGGDEAVRQSVAKDVLGVRTLTALDIDNLHTSPSVVVDYIGQRWMAQAIMPGLLSSARSDTEAKPKAEANGDQSPDSVSDDDFVKPDIPTETTTDKKVETIEPFQGFRVAYGSADTDHPERKYVADPQFHQLAQKVAAHLYLALHKVYDTSGNASELWTSGEIKGVTGQDGKRYLIDLYRLQPVDVEFLEKDTAGAIYSAPGGDGTASPPSSNSDDYKYPHRFVLLRPEAVDSFRDTEMRTWIYSRIADTNTKQRETEEKARSQALVQREGETEEQATRRAEIEALVESIHQPQTIININDFVLTFNPDAFVERKDAAGGVVADEGDPSVKSVRNASNYLRTTVMHSFLTEAINTALVPADTFHLTKQMHARGINMRYLGRLASEATVEKLDVPEKHYDFARQNLSNLVKAFEKEMIVRACKHIIRRLLKRRDLFEVAPCVSHFLNCLLGTSVNPRPAPDTSALPTSLKERPWTLITPEIVRQDVCMEIARRFRYNLPPSRLVDGLRKPQILREVCLRSGIQLDARIYSMDSLPANNDITDDSPSTSKKGAKKGSKTPSRQRNTVFEPQDIVQIVPLVKDLPHKSTLADETFERGSNMLSQGNITVGEALVSDAINYYEQIFGSVHSELAHRYHELAVTYHQLSLPTSRACNIYEASKRNSDMDERKKQRAESGFDSDEMYEQAKLELRSMVESAVQMNRQSIIIAERTLGCDNHVTAGQYIDLGILEHAAGNVKLGLALLRHGVELYNTIYGPHHPEAIRGTVNASQIMTQWQGHAAAVPILQTALDLTTKLRGQEAVLTGQALSQLANAQAMAGDLVQSRNTADRAKQVFENRLGNQDEKTVEAANLYEILSKAIVNRERGEQAKLERLARRLGLQENRAKQLLDRRATSGSSKRSKKAVDVTEGADETASTSTDAYNAISQMPLEELVKGPPPPHKKNGRKVAR